MVCLTSHEIAKIPIAQERPRFPRCLISYDAYIRSEAWKALRRKAIERDEHRCRICDSVDDLEVHHRRYPEGGSWDTDCLDALTTLCHDCHVCITDRLRSRKYAEKDIPVTRNVERVTPIFDPEDAYEQLQVIEVPDHRRVTPAYP